MLELQPRFADKYREAMEWVRRRVAGGSGPNTGSGPASAVASTGAATPSKVIKENKAL